MKKLCFWFLLFFVSGLAGLFQVVAWPFDKAKDFFTKSFIRITTKLDL